MQKHAITLGIWVVAAAVLLAVYWPSTPDSSSVLADVAPTATVTVADAERGRALFLAKGCATCHTHASAPVREGSFQVGPNLTSYRADPEFLQRWLRNPQAIRPNARMPNLNLKQEEIDALTAFLSASQP